MLRLLIIYTQGRKSFEWSYLIFFLQPLRMSEVIDIVWLYEVFSSGKLLLFLKSVAHTDMCPPLF